jgi:hypothetical protein
MILFLDFLLVQEQLDMLFLNKMRKMPSKFILVQLPEVLLKERTKNSLRIFVKKCKNNIAELTKERLRRAGKKVREDNPDWNGDIGFRVLNSIHLISVRGKPQQKPFHNRLMPM